LCWEKIELAQMEDVSTASMSKHARAEENEGELNVSMRWSVAIYRAIQFICLLAAACGVVALGRCYSKYTRSTRELDHHERLLVQLKRVEYGQYSPLSSRLLALASCSALFWYFLRYIKGREERRNHMLGAYWWRYSFLLLASLLIFAYLAVSGTTKELSRLRHSGQSNRGDTWGVATVKGLFDRDKRRRQRQRSWFAWLVY